MKLLFILYLMTDALLGDFVAGGAIDTISMFKNVKLRFIFHFRFFI